MIVREHIPKAELSDDQRRKLKLVNDNDLFAAFNQILKQRGIPLAVFAVSRSPCLMSSFGTRSR
jgi:hypothetical protein